MDTLAFHIVILGLLGIFQLVEESNGAAAGISPNRQNFADGMNYMKRYGWVAPPNPEASELVTEMEMRRHVILMQRFFRLPQTGQLDAATIAVMQKPRCGVPDTNIHENKFRPSRYAIDPRLKWDKTDLTYSFENETPDLRPTQVRDLIASALKVWSDVTPLKFREISKEATADIEISFERRDHGDGYPLDGQGGTLAHAFFPGPGIGGDAHFDDDETFLYNTDVDGIDLFTVAAHELGHSLGLGHSEDPTALMAPFYQGYNPHFMLNYDDIVGIQMLYGSQPRNPNPPPQPPREPYNPDSGPGVDSVTYAPEIPTTTAVPEDPVCKHKFDAMANIRGELFFFKGEEMWRTSDEGIVYDGYPTKISVFWENLPDDLTAAFETSNGLINFVKGNEYWEFKGLTPTDFRPKPITNFGLPSTISIDAVLPLPREQKILFFFESQVWSYDERSQLIDEGYPMPIKKAWDISTDLSAAFRFKDETYFVKSKRYWKLNETSQAVAEGYPKYFNVEWFGCKMPVTKDTEGSAAGSASRTLSATNSLFLSVIALVMGMKRVVL